MKCKARHTAGRPLGESLKMHKDWLSGGGPGETSPLPSQEAQDPGSSDSRALGQHLLPASSHQVGRAPGLRTILDRIQDLLPNLTSSYLYSPLLGHIPSCTSALSLLGVFLTCIHPYIEVLKPSMALYPSHRAHPEPIPHAHLAHPRANVQDRGLGRDLSIHSQRSHTPMDRMGMMQILI